jgi:hypothetical protein
MLISRTLGLALVVGTWGCMMPPQGAALMQQTAQEFNFDLRFGRMELAVEQVAPKYAEDFQKRHRYWGSVVHITDAETVGLHMKGSEGCDVSVRIGWYRVEEGDLHTTLVKQRWHLYPKGWLLDAEERLDGDIGALGEKVDVLAPDNPRGPSQFPTIRLGTDT